MEFDNHKVGKWIYFFKEKKFVEKICKNALVNNVVKEAKHTDGAEGVACFYLHYDDHDAHKRVYPSLSA